MADWTWFLFFRRCLYLTEMFDIQFHISFSDLSKKCEVERDVRGNFRFATSMFVWKCGTVLYLTKLSSTVRVT